MNSQNKINELFNVLNGSSGVDFYTGREIVPLIYKLRPALRKFVMALELSPLTRGDELKSKIDTFAAPVLVDALFFDMKHKIGTGIHIAVVANISPAAKDFVCTLFKENSTLEEWIPIRDYFLANEVELRELIGESSNRQVNNI